MTADFESFFFFFSEQLRPLLRLSQVHSVEVRITLDPINWDSRWYQRGDCIVTTSYQLILLAERDRELTPALLVLEKLGANWAIYRKEPDSKATEIIFALTEGDDGQAMAADSAAGQPLAGLPAEHGSFRPEDDRNADTAAFLGDDLHSLGANR